MAKAAVADIPDLTVSMTVAVPPWRSESCLKSTLSTRLHATPAPDKASSAAGLGRWARLWGAGDGAVGIPKATCAVSGPDRDPPLPHAKLEHLLARLNSASMM